MLAEHQLKELLSDDCVSEETLNETFVIKNQHTPTNNPSKEERRNKFQRNKENISHDCIGPVKTISCQTDNNVTLKEDRHFKTSPTSAFEKYAPASGNRMPTPVPLDFENENFLPPIVNTKRTGSQALYEGHTMNRYPLISLSNLSLCSSVSIDIPEDNRKLGTCRSAEVRGKEFPNAKRSISASVDKSTGNNRNYVKKNLKMENMLYGNEDNSCEALDSDDKEQFRNTDVKLDKLNGVSNADNFDLTDSFNEFENVLKSSYYDNEICAIRPESPLEKREESHDRGDSMASKMSIDSAYSR